ncbi:MAG: diaminopimelate decarboxylase [Oscillochloridaceae bacterium umkhey_bin13]
MPQPIPVSAATIAVLTATYPTPFYLYDEAGIRATTRALQAAFAWAPAFREYFAVKATPTPRILHLLRDEGCGADCSSLAELMLAERCGLLGDMVMFTSNNTPPAEFVAAHQIGALINLDDFGLFEVLIQQCGLPEFISFRYNPGTLAAGNPIIGHPEAAKFGMTRTQLFDGYRAARDAGIRRFGLHAMIASNELDQAALVASAELLFQVAVDLGTALGITFELINLGGGIGIPYQPDQQPVDLQAFGAAVQVAYGRAFGGAMLGRPALAMECGRLITGPHGYLISRVRHLKHTYRHYVGLDATMADLMRPGMYGAYHHLSVLGKEDLPATELYDVTGSLCENNDKFAIQRALPPIEPGDLVIIHDAGAHGRAMGFNYNGRLRPAEVLLTTDGTPQLIRRAETLDDYFATVIW